jgi:hypothetical protein
MRKKLKPQRQRRHKEKAALPICLPKAGAPKAQHTQTAFDLTQRETKWYKFIGWKRQSEEEVELQ